MDAFDLAKNDLETSMRELQKLVQTVIETNGIAEKKKHEMAARPILREARRKLAALRAEARQVADPGERTRCENICKENDERIRNLDSEMKNQIFPSRAPTRPKTYEQKREEELLGEGNADGSNFQSAGQVLDAAVRVQADALQSLNRTERLQNVTEEQGKATLMELQKQTEKMYQVDEELANLQGELDRAARDVRWFARQMAKDKCCLTLFGLVVLALVALVFISIWTKRKKKNSSNNSTSASFYSAEDSIEYSLLCSVGLMIAAGAGVL